MVPPAPSASPKANPPASSPAPDDAFMIPVDEPPLLDEPLLTKPLESPEEASSIQSEFAAEAYVPADAPFYSDTEAAEQEKIAFMPPPRWPEPETVVSPGQFLLFLGALIFMNGLLGIYCFYHPEGTESFLARLPVLGTFVTGERFSARHIVLSDLEGHYQITRDNQKVFMMYGSATNNAALPARTIQIEGAIYDAKGRNIGKRLIFCGTNIAPDRLANLTLREIGALQDLVPPKQFHVMPGDAVKFLIVFTTPPPTVTEFSSRVVAAQFGSV
ncbi:MAG TPA: DUF3426 domain-containing protein [Methylomirabilota bacterium]|nr:DUF3426 domain-containing protein [Methylomirabilota bacterium]